MEQTLGKRQVKGQMGQEQRAWRKTSKRDAPGKELGMVWGRDAFRLSRMWTGIWEEKYPRDGAVGGQALGLYKGLQSGELEEGGGHLEGIYAPLPTRYIPFLKIRFVIWNLGFALLGLPLLCKASKRVHLVKSSALEEVRRSNAFQGTNT